MPDEKEFKPEFIKSKLLGLVQRIIVVSVWNDKGSIARALGHLARTLVKHLSTTESTVNQWASA